MTPLPSKERGPGFQRSETSSAELHIYEQPTDPVLSLINPDANKAIAFDGRRIYDTNPSLIEVSTTKEMGAASGTWSAIVKQANPPSRRGNLRDIIADDAWVDIHFSRHNRRYFTMRGMVNDIREVGAVTGTGATTTAYSISGQDFGKIWELTPLWFNKYINDENPPENVAGASAMRVFSSLGLGGSVPDVVRAYLYGFLQELGNTGRANWRFPKGMPQVGADPAFIENIGFDAFKFTNDPPRIAIAPNFLDPDGANSWAMAQEWSDPTFVEMFADLVESDSFNTSRDLITDVNARPTIVLRDRPFPTLALGKQSPWYNLPEVFVPREDVIDDDLGRTGGERYNAFFVSPQVLTEFTGSANIEVTAPLWDEKDMRVHGFRRFDVNSRYQLDLAETANTGDSLLTITKQQREKCRDWYAINPYLYNGNISFSRGVLEARIGKRLRIPGRSAGSDFTSYIESVSHNWRFGQGIRTSLGVTRGWHGTDDTYLKALQLLASRYGGNRQGDAVATPLPAGEALA